MTERTALAMALEMHQVQLERAERADARALDYARQLAHLRAAAVALLHHDTPENRSKLYSLAYADQWAAECEEFGCHDDNFTGGAV